MRCTGLRKDIDKNMQIRKMTIDDYESAYQLWSSAPGMGLRSLDDSCEGISRYLARNPETCFVAVNDEGIVGTILCGHDGRRGFIYHTAVAVDFQRSGIGTALVDAAGAALKKKASIRSRLSHSARTSLETGSGLPGVSPIGRILCIEIKAFFKEDAAMTSTTRVQIHLNASRSKVYETLLDPRRIADWKVPEGMTAQVHAFDAREGGEIRVSLSYDQEEAQGKTQKNVDTYHGRFIRLIPDEVIVEVDAFESDDPALQGDMTITYILTDSVTDTQAGNLTGNLTKPSADAKADALNDARADTLAGEAGGTDLQIVHEGLPAGVLETDNELGWRMALVKLATLVEEACDIELDSGPFYHGTKAELKLGDLLEPNYHSNYGERKKANFVYLTATLEAAKWGAELAAGDGPGRIYVVKPTGPIEDDPNLTNKRFPGNPTRSYRTRRPLRVVDEVRDWEGHAPEDLQKMRDHLAELKRLGIEAINE